MQTGLDLTPLWLTLRVAGVSTLAAFLLAVPLDFAVAQRKFWGWEVVDALSTLPLVMPPTVLGYYLIVVVGRHGWLGHWLHETFGITLIFTWQGACLAAAVVSFPLIFKSARTAF
jgi:molybdate transport system permease protein